MKKNNLFFSLLGILFFTACNPCGDDPVTELTFTISVQDVDGMAISFTEQNAELRNEVGFTGYVSCSNRVQDCTIWVMSGDDLLRETGHVSGVPHVNTLFISYTDFTTDTILLEQTSSRDPECLTWEFSEGRVFFNDSLYYEGEWGDLDFGNFVFRK
ncbi:MAG: hypothetical protein AAGH79_02025 [Bacteroidota bacterium]